MSVEKRHSCQRQNTWVTLVSRICPDKTGSIDSITGTDMHDQGTSNLTWSHSMTIMHTFTFPFGFLTASISNSR